MSVTDRVIPLSIGMSSPTRCSPGLVFLVVLVVNLYVGVRGAIPGLTFDCACLIIPSMTKRTRPKPPPAKTIVGVSALLAEIAARGSDKAAIAERLIASGADIGALIQGMKAKPASVKYGCEKVLRIISKRRPELVYPLFAQIAGFIDGESRILNWGALAMLPNLAAVDTRGMFLPLFDRYFATIPGPDLVSASNTINGAAKLARAKPELADRIAAELLKVEKARYKTPECRNVAIGHAIAALEEFFEHLKRKPPVIRFVRRQLRNPRRPVALNAARFLKRFAAQP